MQKCPKCGSEKYFRDVDPLGNGVDSYTCYDCHTYEFTSEIISRQQSRLEAAEGALKKIKDLINAQFNYPELNAPLLIRQIYELLR